MTEKSEVEVKQKGLLVVEELSCHPNPLWVKVVRKILRTFEPVLDFFCQPRLYGNQASKFPGPLT